MADKKRRGAVNWTAQNPPSYPSHSPDIYIGPDGRTHVETTHGADDVYFLSAAPRSHSGPLAICHFDEDVVDQYVTDFYLDHARLQAKAKAGRTSMEEAIDDVQLKLHAMDEAEAEARDNASRIDDGFDDDDGSELTDIFSSQAHTWRAVLKRRERAAIKQTEAALIHLLSSSETWQMHLRTNATIRSIIRGLEGKPAQYSVSLHLNTPHKHSRNPRPPSQPRTKEKPLTTTPAASLFILRDSRHATDPITCAHPDCPLPSHSISTGTTGTGAAYLSLERVDPSTDPSTAAANNDIKLTTTPGIQVDDDVYIPVFMRPNDPKPETDSVQPPIVHASLCIGCLRNLYAAEVEPPLPAVPNAASPPASTPGSSGIPADSNDADANDANANANADDGEKSEERVVRLTATGFEWRALESSRWTAVNLPYGVGGIIGGGVEEKKEPDDTSIEWQLDGAGKGSGNGGGKGAQSIGVGCVLM